MTKRQLLTLICSCLCFKKPLMIINSFWDMLDHRFPLVSIDRYWCKPEATLVLCQRQLTLPVLVVKLCFFSSMMRYIQRYALFFFIVFQSQCQTIYAYACIYYMANPVLWLVLSRLGYCSTYRGWRRRTFSKWVLLSWRSGNFLCRN